MFISTIIPTIGRPTLARSVQSVLDQRFQGDECEVIVVNDSGRDLSIEDWQKQANVRIISTNKRNRSVARNTGAALATGQYLHFLDDDDWMLPAAFEAFWMSTRTSSAVWFHGAFSLVDNAGAKIVDVFPDEFGNCFINLVSWEWIPLQASIVHSDAFFRIGGFAMLESLDGGFEDIHLSRQIASKYNFMHIPSLVACVRAGDSGSTTNYADMFIQNRRSREINLDMPGSLQRLISSARDNRSRNGYWYGKIIYYLLTSTIRNLKARRFLTAVGRIVSALLCVSVAGRHLLQAEFWYGATRPHYPRVWLAIKASGTELFRNTRWSSNL